MAAAMFFSDITRYPLFDRAGFPWLQASAICLKIFHAAISQHRSYSVMFTYDMAMARFSILIVTFLFLIICSFGC
jgi:hypothetical protein